MKKFLILLLCWYLHASAGAQSKAELEAERKKTQEEISYVDNLLKTTAREKNAGMNEVRIIGKKLILRESMISGMRSEIDLLTDRISLNTVAVDMMEEDLKKLKDDYARAVVNSYKTGKIYPEFIYVLSARDFNQGYKRLKYLQQVTKFRRQESETILALKSNIEASREKLQSDLLRVSDLKSKEEQQKELLQNERNRKQKLVQNLGSKEKQLRKELEEKKKVAKRIDSEIAKLIEEERRRAVKTNDTPEQKLISDNFIENKGRLPWPVEKGIITSHFGIQTNPVLKYVKEENIGIEITSTGRAAVRSVFKGEVATIFSIKGSNMTVIVKHGKYFSVYNNIVNVKVKPGQKIETKQNIGEVFEGGGEKGSVLEFMIYDSKYQDPEAWISKNQ
jgi:septal ring factor EnvC (AmiA/AmiB activator)